MIRPIKRPPQGSTDDTEKPRKLIRTVGRSPLKQEPKKSVTLPKSETDWLDEPEQVSEYTDYPVQEVEPEQSERKKPVFNKKRTVKFIIECLIGFVLIGFGIINAGSYYTSATRFSGVLADVFYLYQAGPIMIMIGIVVVYDSLKRTELM